MTWTFAPIRRLTRLVLAWYVLFVGVSVLASTLQPKTMEVVCSSMGIMKLVVQGEGGDAQVRSSMDCPLCAHATPALPPPIASSTKAKIGDKIFAIGFPLPDALGTEAKYTSGDVSSLSGIGDDKRVIQISAPIQPGNSGRIGRSIRRAIRVARSGGRLSRRMKLPGMRPAA